MGRGLTCGVTGIVTCPYDGYNEDGFSGLLFGVLQSAIGIPLKPLGGMAEFLRIVTESALNHMGRGYELYVPLHKIKVPYQQPSH